MKKRRYWTREEIDTLTRMRAEGEKYRVIADVLGRPCEEVRIKARDLRKTDNRSRVWGEEEESQLIEYVKQGHSDVEIGKLLDRKFSAVRKRRNELGLKTKWKKKSTFWTEERLDTLRRLVFDEKLSNKELAEHFNVTIKAIERQMYRAGIKRDKELLTKILREKTTNAIVFTEDEYEEMKDMFDEGYPLAVIAEKFFVGVATMSDIARRKKWERDRSIVKYRYKQKHVTSFYELFELYMVQCLPFKETAARLKISESVLRKELKRHGIEQRRRQERIRIREEFKDKGKSVNRIRDIGVQG